MGMNSSRADSAGPEWLHGSLFMSLGSQVRTCARSVLGL